MQNKFTSKHTHLHIRQSVGMELDEPLTIEAISVVITRLENTMIAEAIGVPLEKWNLADPAVHAKLQELFFAFFQRVGYHEISARLALLHSIKIEDRELKLPSYNPGFHCDTN